MSSGGNPEATAGTSPGPLGYRPALDGVRAVAIALVILLHLQFLESGGVGLDIFFVLSGFLITTLLLEERERWQRIWVGRFYARRVLRLFPALAFVLLAVMVYAVVAVPAVRQADVFEEVLASALYINDLPSSIWSRHGMLAHTWSLSLEEQFYVVWPWVFLLFIPRRRNALVALLTAGIVVFALVRIADPSAHFLIYTLQRRPDAIAFGCLAALLRWGGQLPRPSRATRAVAVVGAVFLIAVATLGRTGFLRQGSYTAVALAAAIVIVAVVDEPRSRGARLLGLAPFVAVGRISYALYLWHFPIFYAVDDHGSSWPEPVQVFVKLALSAAFATLSLVLVERPTRRWRSRFMPGPRPQDVSTVASQPSASSRE